MWIRRSLAPLPLIIITAFCKSIFWGCMVQSSEILIPVAKSSSIIIAIARMMMVCIYHMVSEKKPFTPTDYEELINPQNHVERVVLNENNVFAYLESLGYDSSKLVKRNDN